MSCSRIQGKIAQVSYYVPLKQLYPCKKFTALQNEGIIFLQKVGYTYRLYFFINIKRPFKDRRLMAPPVNNNKKTFHELYCKGHCMGESSQF